MTTTEIADQAATWLDNEHLNGARYLPLPDDYMPVDIPGAYRIQQAFVARLNQRGRPSFGWKIALTAETMQQMVGVDRPVGGVICGYSVMGRLVSESPPASKITMEMTVAKTGLRMKN